MGGSCEDRDGPERPERPGSTVEDGKSRRLRFVLPPVRLPPIRLPAIVTDWFPFALPVPRRVRGAENRLLAAMVLDVFNAGFVLGGNGGIVRVGVGTVLAVVLAGPVGVGYVLEAVPVWAGYPRVGVFPTATVLVAIAIHLDRGRRLAR